MDRTTPTARWSRRRLLGTALGALAAAPLASCTPTAGAGRLRAAFPGAGSRESLDPHAGSLFIDQARAKALFDTLVAYDDDMSLVGRLAESWEPDASGTRWRVRLRPARFHDGRAVTAEDVLYSYRRVLDPTTGSQARPHFADLDVTASRAHSSTELELVLHRPNFEFPAAWGAPSTEIVPAGTTDFSRPVGSGPFRFASFEPDGPAVFTRFDGYWDGPAEVPGVEFVAIDDENARLSALLSGQVHYAHDLSATSAATLDGDDSAQVLAARFSTMQAVALKIDRPPFSDPRLVRALLSGVDRDQLVRIALGGRGDVGNDLFGKGLRYYAAGLPQRQRDVQRARSLVRAAGAEGMSIPLDTSSAAPYFESAASLIAQQLGDIGLRVRPRVGDPQTYFRAIRTRGVAGHTRVSAQPLPLVLGQRLRGGSSGNYTGYRSPEFDAALERALATSDETERAGLLAEAQRLARDGSGMLVWGFSNWLVGVGSGVDGLRPAPPNSLDWARFQHARLG